MTGCHEGGIGKCDAGIGDNREGEKMGRPAEDGRIESLDDCALRLVKLLKRRPDRRFCQVAPCVGAADIGFLLRGEYQQ